MYFFSTALTGISAVLSVFLIAVVARSLSKFHSPIFRYLLGAFAVIFLDSVFTIFSIFLFKGMKEYVPFVYIASDLVILLLFYGAVIKGR